jgi:hypothetical protein
MTIFILNSKVSILISYNNLSVIALRDLKSQVMEDPISVAANGELDNN